MKRFFKTIICLLSFLLISSLALTGGTVFASTSINNVNANEAKLNVKAAITIDQKRVKFYMPKMRRKRYRLHQCLN